MRTLLCVVAVLMSVLPVAAQSDRDWDECKDPDPEPSIRGCTRIIQSRASAVNRAQAYYNRGIAWSDKGDVEKSFADYNEALKLDPKHVKAYNNRGNYFLRKGDYRRALQDYDAAVRIDPNYASGHNNRGEAYENMDDLAQAREAYTIAIRLDPAYARAWFNRGDIQRKSGDIPAAIEDYGGAIRLQPEHAAALEYRGYMLFWQGRFRESAEDLTRSVELRPGILPTLFRYLARARYGESAESDLSADAARLTDQSWPYPVVELYLGRRSPQALIDAAENDNQRCQAEFYVGEWHIIRGDFGDGRDRLQAAADKCPPRFIEAGAARGEVERIAASSSFRR